ncbi:MAG: phosphoribosylaminoimidazolesuccinocarboxamide synthase [Clostridia bacterium]
MVNQAEQIYEGKAKKVYATDDPNLVIVDYKDDATAFNGLKKGTIIGKGIVNNRMSNFMFQKLEEFGIPTHYVEELSERRTLVKRVEIVKVEVVVRNIVAGSLSKRLGLAEGTTLKSTVLEYSYKDDALGDPMINDYHIKAIGLATEDEMKKIANFAFEANRFMKGFFKNMNIDLVDFKLEFGRYNGEIILADEISPDTCRFWDSTTHEKLDKDRFRRDMGGVEDAYAEMMRRVLG